MQRSFTYTLLITWVIIFGACKTQYVKTSSNTRNVVVSDSLNQLDNQMVQIYLPYKKMLEKDMNRVIAISEKEMFKGKPESGLTNFLADLLLDEGNKYLKNAKHNFQADISYFNYGGIRTFLPEGEITVGKIYELMPFENEMVFLKLNGRQVQGFLNSVANNGGDSVGGVRFKISEGKASGISVGGKSLQADKGYWLVTNDYIAQGGDDFEMLTQRSEYVNSGQKIRDIIIAHLEMLNEQGKVLSAETDGRITNE
jgi:2',3'-cyclic-nucleotide 2'-phosphodiesterase (5'-nucleotidase family)